MTVLLLFQMILSVLLITATTLNQIDCRRLEDINNEVSSIPEENLSFSTGEWVKINNPPVAVMTKKVGAHMELHCEAMGSPPPTIQWYKSNRRITENEVFETNSISRNPALAQV